MKSGVINLLPGAFVQNLKPQELAADPELSTLTAEGRAIFWYNITEDKYKYFNGTAIRVMGGEELPTDLLRADGSVAMAEGSDFLLAGADQSASADNAAVSKGHVALLVSTKQDTITGSATTILADNLAADIVVVTNADGKMAAAAVTAAELAHLTGATAPLQTQIDSKQAALGYAPFNKAGDVLEGELNANGKKISNLPAPVDGTDAARQIDIENAIAGMNWQDDVKDTQVDATLDPTDAPAKGVRYIITDPAALHANFGTITDVAKNDIVAFNGTDFVVVFASLHASAQGTTLWNEATSGFLRIEGTGETQAWKPFGGISGVTAGAGLSKSGNTIEVKIGAGIIADVDGFLQTDVAADGSIQLLDSGDGEHKNKKVAVKLNGATLTSTAEGLAVSAGGITETEIAASAFGAGLTGGAGTAAAIKIKADGLVAVDEGGVFVDETALAAKVLYKTGGSVDALQLVAAPVAELDVVNLKHLDERLAGVSGSIGGVVAVYDKTGEADVAAKVHTFKHDKGSRFGNITVFDDAGYQIIPDEAVCVDANTVRVELTVAMKVAIAFAANYVKPAPVPEPTPE